MLVQTALQTTRTPAVAEAAVDLAHLRRLLGRFEPIRLAEMESVALLKRTDTKLLLHFDQLVAALSALTDDYRVLDVAGRRLHRYRTLYFDTPDFALYHHHHNGRRSRYKIRERAYVDSGLAFVEVKHKVRSDRTVKHRQALPAVATRLDPGAAAFVSAHSPFIGPALEPKLWNDFFRVTLVSQARVERLTIDVDLRFEWRWTGVELPGVVIAEVKQERFSPDSAFLEQMRRLGVRPGGFSKYCAGAALLYPHLKSNNFKPRLLALNRLAGMDLAGAVERRSLWTA